MSYCPCAVANPTVSVLRLSHYTNTAGDCLARMVLVTANHNPHACRLLVTGWVQAYESSPSLRFPGASGGLAHQHEQFTPNQQVTAGIKKTQ